MVEAPRPVEAKSLIPTHSTWTAEYAAYNERRAVLGGKLAKFQHLTQEDFEGRVNGITSKQLLFTITPEEVAEAPEEMRMVLTDLGLLSDTIDTIVTISTTYDNDFGMHLSPTNKDSSKFAVNLQRDGRSRLVTYPPAPSANSQERLHYQTMTNRLLEFYEGGPNHLNLALMESAENWAVELIEKRIKPSSTSEPETAG